MSAPNLTPPVWVLNSDDDYQGHQQEEEKEEEDDNASRFEISTASAIHSPPHPHKPTTREDTRKAELLAQQAVLKKEIAELEKSMNKGETTPSTSSTHTSQTPPPPFSSDVSINIEDDLLTVPILEVGGPTGPQLVYRAWPKTDLANMARQHLPDQEQGGEAVATAILNMVKVLRPTMTELKMILASIYGISFVNTVGLNMFDDGQFQQQLRHTEYEHKENEAY